MPMSVRDAVAEVSINAVHDVGIGICIHDFVQTPCERHLQCSAECKDYIWRKDDPGRLADLKRQWAVTTVARETAKEDVESGGEESADWVVHNDKKLRVLEQQLKDAGVEPFDPHAYLEELASEET